MTDDRVLALLDEYMIECESPAPDLAYRRVLRDRLFDARRAQLEGEGR